MLVLMNGLFKIIYLIAKMKKVIYNIGSKNLY